MASLCCELSHPLTPIVRFPPPLATVLRWGQEESPVDLTAERVHLNTSAEGELQYWQSSHADIRTQPLNEKQRRKFSFFRTIPKRYPTPQLAVCHALYGDVLTTYNGFMNDLRRFFLPGDTQQQWQQPQQPGQPISDGDGARHAKKPKWKSKVSLDAVLNAVCQARAVADSASLQSAPLEVRVDIVITTPARDFLSVYTSHRGGVVVDPDTDGGDYSLLGQGADIDDGDHCNPWHRRRAVVILDWDADVGWAPVEYSAAAAATVAKKPISEPPHKNVSGAAVLLGGVGEGDDTGGLSISPMSSSPEGTPRRPQRGGDNAATTDSGAGKRRSRLDVSDAYLDALVSSKTAALALPPFEAVVAKGDRCFHLTGSRLAAKGRDQGLHPSHPRRPFEGLRYPNLDMCDCGIFTLMCEPLSYEGRVQLTTLRVVVASCGGLAAAALAVALLVLLWSGDVSSCCTQGLSSLNTTATSTQCWNVSSESFVNASLSALSAESLCISWMCPVNGTLRSAAFDAYFFGGWFSVGRLLWLCIGGSAFAVLAAVVVNHTAVRTMALLKSRPAFVYAAQGAHVLLAAATCAAAAYTLYLIVSLRGASVDVLDECSWFDAAARGTCLAARTCGTSLVVHFASDAADTRAVAIAIVVVVCSGIHFVVALAPAMAVGPESRVTELEAAVPDTEIFVPGLYAPDGATETELERIQVTVKQGLTKPSHVDQQRQPSALATGKQKLMRAFKNMRMGRQLAGASSGNGGLDSSDKDANRSTSIPSSPTVVHYAVHDSSDLRLPASVRPLARKHSLTFAARKADHFESLSGAVLRDVELISSRVRYEVLHGRSTSPVVSPPPPPAASASAEGTVDLGMVDSRSHSPLCRYDSTFTTTSLPVVPVVSVAAQKRSPVVTDKYSEVRYQLGVLQQVSAQRDAVIDSIASRLKQQQPQQERRTASLT